MQATTTITRAITTADKHNDHDEEVSSSSSSPVPTSSNKEKEKDEILTKKIGSPSPPTFVEGKPRLKADDAATTSTSKRSDSDGKLWKGGDDRRQSRRRRGKSSCSSAPSPSPSPSPSLSPSSSPSRKRTQQWEEKNSPDSCRSERRRNKLSAAHGIEDDGEEEGEGEDDERMDLKRGGFSTGTRHRRRRTQRVAAAKDDGWQDKSTPITRNRKRESDEADNDEEQPRPGDNDDDDDDEKEEGEEEKEEEEEVATTSVPPMNGRVDSGRRRERSRRRRLRSESSLDSFALGPSSQPFSSRAGTSNLVCSETHREDEAEEQEEEHDVEAAVAVPIEAPTIQATPVEVATSVEVVPNDEAQQDEDDNDDSKQRQNPKSRSRNDQGRKPMSVYRRRRILAAAVFSILAAVGVVLVLHPAKNPSKDAVERMGDGPWQRLEKVSGADVYDPSTSRGKAAHWVLVEDSFVPRADNSTTEDRILQRYLLALLYHSTSENQTWKLCGPSLEEVCHLSPVDSAVLSADDVEDLQTDLPYSTPWLSADTDECTWFGVDCSAQGRVAGIYLRENHLRGTLAPELHLLSELQIVDFRANSLSGTLPVEYLVEMPKLVVLDLTTNFLTGTLPREGLQSLPSFSSSSFSSSLEVLSVTENIMHGTIPPWLGQQLINLTVLRLSVNSFTGSIPTTLAQLHRLDLLWLNDNKLVHGIPSEMGALQNVRLFALQRNDLGGTIPSSLGNLTNVRDLYLSGARLSGPIPTSLYFLEQMERFHVNDNTLSGRLSEDVGNLKNMQRFIVRHNFLTGVIPTSFAQLPQLERLWLHYNFFGGTMPEAICALPQLADLSSDCKRGNAPRFFVSCPCCTMCCDASRASEETGTVDEFCNNGSGGGGGGFVVMPSLMPSVSPTVVDGGASSPRSNIFDD